MHNGQNESEPSQEDITDKKFYLMIVPAHGKPECKEFTLKDFLFESGNAEANFDTPRYTKDSDYKLNTLGYQNAFFAFQK